MTIQVDLLLGGIPDELRKAFERAAYFSLGKPRVLADGFDEAGKARAKHQAPFAFNALKLNRGRLVAADGIHLVAASLR